MTTISALKSRLRDSRFHRWLERSRAKTAVAGWEAAGRPVPPPPAYKQSVIREAAARFHTRVLVETGTAWGATTAASLGLFETIHSIELSDELYNAARRRFQRHRQVHLWHGDSADQLPRVLDTIAQPAVFWLDAHYSGEGTAQADVDTPIAQELRTIARHGTKGHVILIDDARCFDGTNGYPTIDSCRQLAGEYWPSYHFDLEHDIMRITPS